MYTLGRFRYESRPFQEVTGVIFIYIYIFIYLYRYIPGVKLQVSLQKIMVRSFFGIKKSRFSTRKGGIFTFYDYFLLYFHIFSRSLGNHCWNFHHLHPPSPTTSGLFHPQGLQVPKTSKSRGFLRPLASASRMGWGVEMGRLMVRWAG